MLFRRSLFLIFQVGSLLPDTFYLKWNCCKGNHDRINNSHKKYFEWIKDYEVVKDGEDHVVLFHYPIAHWINADHDYVHLYGHIHKSRDSRPFNEYKIEMEKRKIPYECYNVGCMLHNYTPVTLNNLKSKSL